MRQQVENILKTAKKDKIYAKTHLFFLIIGFVALTLRQYGAAFVWHATKLNEK